MPVQIKSENGKCYARWGNAGKKYYYKCNSKTALENAKKKAIAQGVAIGDFIIDSDKISFDFDDVLTTDKGKALAIKYINEGKEVYIITRRNRIFGYSVYKLAKELGIPVDRIYFTNGKLKWETIKSLNISKHFDNNENEVDKINENTDAIGVLLR